MKRIDFENGNIVSNILKAALPMLVAQIMSLLYNIVDRVYIARIPDVGTTALGAVGLSRSSSLSQPSATCSAPAVLRSSPLNAAKAIMRKPDF